MLYCTSIFTLADALMFNDPFQPGAGDESMASRYARFEAAAVADGAMEYSTF